MLQEPRESCLVEEWDALTTGGFVRSHGSMNGGYVGYEFDSTKGYPGEGPPAKQREQPESVVRCMALNFETTRMGWVPWSDVRQPPPLRRGKPC